MSYFEWPKTVKEWRDRGWKPDGSRPYDLWKRKPLQKLNKAWETYNVQLHPPNDEPRRPDGYTFLSRYQCQPGILIYKPEFSQAASSIVQHTIYNQDVLIRLISIDGDATGDDHYEAIRRLSQGQTAFRGDNYALPLLNELVRRVVKWENW
ncbi:hypothetical protein ARMGADRAFT_1158253 [Armillaria gallica]|uniref:Uncharacterized protein n=1 Tax=Armillaria gallica TaxID=47427 RepID=A0A2H3EE20_ARMGA|nr:hypothetical protein ARMGADRAFT_1158253 [Armillaria gallica]